MMTSEQLTVNPEVGSLDACGPINYKIPGIKNIPKDFKVSLLKEAAGGHKELYSSKVRICIYIQVFAVIFFDEKFSCIFFFLQCSQSSYPQDVKEKESYCMLGVA